MKQTFQLIITIEQLYYYSRKRDQHSYHYLVYFIMPIKIKYFMKSKQSVSSIHHNPLTSPRTVKLKQIQEPKYKLSEASSATNAKASSVSIFSLNSPQNSEHQQPTSTETTQLNFSVTSRKFMLPIQPKKLSLNPQYHSTTDRFGFSSPKSPVQGVFHQTDPETPKPTPKLRFFVSKVMERLKQGKDVTKVSESEVVNKRMSSNTLHLKSLQKLPLPMTSSTVVEKTLLGQTSQDNTVNERMIEDYKQHIESARERNRIKKDLIRQEKLEGPEELIRQDRKKLEDGSIPQGMKKMFPPQSISLLSPRQSKAMAVPYIDLKNIEDNMAYKDERTDFIQRYSLAKANIQNVSPQDYFYCMKNFEKLEDFQQLYQQRDNIYISLLKASKSHESMPRTLDMIREGRAVENINSARMLKGAKNAQIFSQVLQHSQGNQIKSINIASNGIRMQSLPNLLKSMPKHLEILNLADNQLDSNAIIILAKNLEDHLQSLKSLNLESNKFGDKGCKILCEYLAQSKMIGVLNLSRNNLTAVSAESLSYLIRKSTSIQELYLHYNSIDDKGGMLIFRGLYRSTSIKVVDISFNNLGTKKPVKNSKFLKVLTVGESAAAIARVISKPHVELVHLDISNNSFNLLDTKEIAKSLHQNQYLFGIHFEGNQREYFVDPDGFLINKQEQEEKIRKSLKHTAERDDMLTTQKMLVEDNEFGMQNLERKKLEGMINQYEQKNPLRLQQPPRRINSTNCLPIRKGRDLNSDTCWICDGWQEVKFSWQAGRSGGIRTEPLYLHLDFLDYKPILMQFANDEFTLYRMCPPNTTVCYFFSNPVLGIQTFAKNQLVEELPENDPLRVSAKMFIYNQEIELEGQLVTHLNYLHTFYEKPCIDALKHYNATFNTKPREELKIFDFNPYKKKKENKWSIENSIFNNYQTDNEAIMNECFEFDFESSKIARLVKEAEVSSVREILRKFYQLFFNGYKYYASASLNQSIPCVGIQSFNDLIYSTRILDNNRIKATDIEVNFISTNGKDLKYPNVVEKALVRYQMLEILVRISIDKYYRTGTCSQISGAVKKLLNDDGVTAWFQEFESAQFWRDDRFWHPEVDTLLKKRLPMLRLLFKYTASINPKNKYYKHIWVAQKDFRDLFARANLLSENLNEKEVYLGFLLSVTTQVDELNHCRHFQMQFYEFIEGLARIADKLSLYIPKRDQAPLKLEDRRLLPLVQKIDALFLVIYYRLGDVVKKSFNSFGDADVADFDNSVLGFKKARIRQSLLMNIFVSPNIQQRSIKPAQMKARKSFLQFSDSSNSGSESDDADEFDPIKQESELAEQLKVVALAPSLPIEKITLQQVVKEAKRTRLDKIRDQYTLVTIVKYLRNLEENLIRQHLNEAKEQILGI